MFGDFFFPVSIVSKVVPEYDNIFDKLSDLNSPYWQYFDKTGDIQLDWWYKRQIVDKNVIQIPCLKRQKC